MSVCPSVHTSVITIASEYKELLTSNLAHGLVLLIQRMVLKVDYIETQYLETPIQVKPLGHMQRPNRTKFDI